MRLSTRTQYGLRILCQLALEYQSGPMQLSAIGTNEGISEKYLGQIMLILRSSGLVSAQRGAQGGYFLSREPDRITLLEAFEVLEGEVLGTGDTKDPANTDGSRSTEQIASEIWERLRDAISRELSQFTLADLIVLGKYKDGFFDYLI